MGNRRFDVIALHGSGTLLPPGAPSTGDTPAPPNEPTEPLTPDPLVGIHPQLLQFPVQCGPFHSDELCGPGNVAAKAQ